MKICYKLCLFLAFFLLSTAAAQTEGSDYALTLSYKKSMFGDLMSFVGMQKIDKAAIKKEQPLIGYKAEIISFDGKTLGSVIFDIPLKNGMFNVTSPSDAITFTIYLPYFSNIGKINIYDKESRMLLEIPVQDEQQSEELEGYLEVLHIDDFENPQNSKYIHYLVSGGKRYELKYEKQLPVVLSGTYVKVKGKVRDDKLMVDSPTDSFEVIPINYEQVSEEESVNAEQSHKFNLSAWYIAIPLLAILLFISYIEIKRKKEHAALVQQYKQQNIEAIRNYITTSLRKGYTKEQITDALARSNYSNEEINEAFSKLR